MLVARWILAGICAVGWVWPGGTVSGGGAPLAMTNVHTPRATAPDQSRRPGAPMPATPLPRTDFAYDGWTLAARIDAVAGKFIATNTFPPTVPANPHSPPPVSRFAFHVSRFPPPPPRRRITVPSALVLLTRFSFVFRLSSSVSRLSSFAYVSSGVIN